MLPTNLAFAMPGKRSIYVTEYQYAQIEVFSTESDGLRLWDGRTSLNAAQD
jgi:hypothetical protein